MSDGILVTGAGGFIGRALIEAIRDTASPPPITGVDLRPDTQTSCNEWLTLDLTDFSALRNVLAERRFGVLFHLAGLARGTDWDALYRANVATTLAILESLADSGGHSVVVVPGSAAEYGPVERGDLPTDESQPLRPISPYGVSKAWQSISALSFRARGVDVRIARLFNIVGPGLPDTFAFGAFAHQLLEIADGRRPAVIETRGLGGLRDFLDVRDAARGLLAVADRGASGEVYNVCSGAGATMRECLRLLIEESRIPAEVDERAEVDARGISDSVGSHEKLSEATDWQPEYSLERSISDFWTGVTGAAR